MKKIIITLAIISSALIMLSMTTRSNQDNKPATYATVIANVEGNSILIHYGGMKFETVKVKFSELFYDKVVDTLNDLSSKGYEVVSSSSVYNNRVTQEHFTLKLKN